MMTVEPRRAFASEAMDDATTLAALTSITALTRLLAEREVDCVVSTGGRPSLPMGLAARTLGRPLFLLEQNAVPGRANRWLMPLARCMFVSTICRSASAGSVTQPSPSHAATSS